jgi:hypothetical protein
MKTCETIFILVAFLGEWRGQKDEREFMGISN